MTGELVVYSRNMKLDLLAISSRREIQVDHKFESQCADTARPWSLTLPHEALPPPAREHLGSSSGLGPCCSTPALGLDLWEFGLEIAALTPAFLQKSI